ncbi:MAG: hypothetical protein DRP11_01270, partial [Candidatus Aenigmatarchaeota archaeon]
MKPICEIIAKELLPAARALIARDLIEKHGLTQKEAARRLGMTQPAISQYKQHLRGRKARILDSTQFISEGLENISSGLAANQINGMEATFEWCELCRRIKSSGILCELHREIY